MTLCWFPDNNPPKSKLTRIPSHSTGFFHLYVGPQNSYDKQLPSYFWITILAWIKMCWQLQKHAVILKLSTQCNKRSRPKRAQHAVQTSTISSLRKRSWRNPVPTDGALIALQSLASQQTRCFCSALHVLWGNHQLNFRKHSVQRKMLGNAARVFRKQT